MHALNVKIMSEIGLKLCRKKKGDKNRASETVMVSDAW